MLRGKEEFNDIIERASEKAKEGSPSPRKKKSVSTGPSRLQQAISNKESSFQPNSQQELMDALLMAGGVDVKVWRGGPKRHRRKKNGS